MIAEFVRSIEGIATVGVLALLLCFAAFCFILIRTWRSDPAHNDAMSRLPLDGADAHHQEIRG